MKTIRGKLGSFYMFIIIAISIVLITTVQYDVGIIYFVLGVLFITCFIYLMFIDFVHYFIIYDEKVIVKNALKKKFKKTFYFNEIDQIEIAKRPASGLSIKITLNTTRKKFFTANNLKDEDLKEIIEAFNKFKESN